MPICIQSGCVSGRGVGMDMSALTMTRMAIKVPGMAAMQPVGWSTGYALVVFLMWCVMMVAMMVPSAAPMVLIHAAVGRKQEKADRPLAATALFVAGYLAVWTAFSVVATALRRAPFCILALPPRGLNFLSHTCDRRSSIGCI
jgi:predicted metal-binding membrane protein